MIRKYCTADREYLIELLRLNTPQYFSPEEERDFLDYLDNKTEDYFVIEEDKEIIGCGGINYIKAEHAACLSWDMLHPRAQGNGLGAQLVKFRIDHIKKDSSYQNIIVRTSQHAYLFYQKMGFNLRQITADYWAPGFDLYYMQMEIDI